MSDLARLSVKVVRYGLYALLLSPLLAWRGFLFPQLTPKVLVFQILVEITAVAALTAFLFSKRPEHWPGKARLASPVILGIVLFLAFSLVAAFGAVDVSRSLWGSNERQDGLVLWLHFLAWLAMLIWYFGTGAELQISPSFGGPKKPSAKKVVSSAGFGAYLQFSYWIAVAIACIALAEGIAGPLGVPIPFEMKSIITGRVSGLFGNPVALGPYLLFHFFYGIQYGLTTLSLGSERRMITAAKTVNRRGSHIILAAGILLGNVLFVAVIMLGQTRGVALGLALALLGIAAVAGFSKSAKPWFRGLALACILLALISPIAVWQFRDRLSNIPVFNRLLFMKESQSTLMRQLAWQSALKGYLDHPVTGWGHDNVYYALNRHYDPRHVSFNLEFNESRLTWYDKSHNAYLDLLVEKGFLGAIIYLGTLFLIGRAVWSLADRLTAVCLAGGFASYLISNAVAFDGFGSLFGFFLFLAWLVLSMEPQKIALFKFGSRSDRSAGKKAGKSDAGIGTARGLAALFLISAAVMGVYGNISIALASSKCLSAQNMIEANPMAGSAEYQAAFTHFFPYSAMEKLNCAASILKGLIGGKPMPDPRSTVSYAIQLTQEAAAQHPQDVAIHMIINDFYNTLALYVDPQFVSEAEAAGRRAIELSPKRQEAKFYLGRTLILGNRPFEAVALNRQMVSEYPDFPIAHWFLGLSLMAADQRDEARLEIVTALKMGYKFQNNREIETIKKYFGERESERIIKGQ